MASILLTTSNGSVSGYSISNGGSFTSVPNLYVDDSPTGNTAALTCTLDGSGTINSVSITYAGSDYTNNPNVSVIQVLTVTR